MDGFSFFFVWTIIAFGAGITVHWWMARRRIKRLQKRIAWLEQRMGMPPQ